MNTYEELLELALTIKRRYPRMSHLCEAITCPHCSAAPSQPCLKGNGHLTDQPHIGRWNAWNELVYA